MAHANYRPGLTDEELEGIALTDEQRELAAKNYGLVGAAARRYQTMHGGNLEDLTSMFDEAIVYAARSYRAEVGATFATHAWIWFRNAISRASLRRMIKVPLTATEHPTTRAAALASLELLFTSESHCDHRELEQIPDHQAEEDDTSDDIAMIRREIDRLDRIDHDVIKDVVLGGVTLRVFGAAHGISGERTRQIRDRAVNELRVRVGMPTVPTKDDLRKQESRRRRHEAREHQGRPGV